MQPAHVALQGGYDPATTIDLIKAGKKTVAPASKQSLIHFACAHGNYTQPFVEQLVELDGAEAFATPNARGELPLHVVVQRSSDYRRPSGSKQQPSEVFKLYEWCLTVNADAVSQPDGKGRLPLHLCVARNEGSVVKALLEQFPDAAKMQDDDGKTPLHYACGADDLHPGQALDTVKALLEVDQTALMASDNEGLSVSLPLPSFFGPFSPHDCCCSLLTIVAVHSLYSSPCRSVGASQLSIY